MMRLLTPEDRIHELERALTQARDLAEAERRRATLAEDSAKRAWQLAAWPGVPRRGDDGQKAGS